VFGLKVCMHEVTYTVEYCRTREPGGTIGLWSNSAKGQIFSLHGGSTSIRGGWATGGTDSTLSSVFEPVVRGFRRQFERRSGSNRGNLVTALLSMSG
jgi:hypothetical protein